MKFHSETGSQKASKNVSQRVKNDIDLLLKRLPVLNDYFQLHDKIGKGTFSHVYLATPKNGNPKKKYAVKHLIHTCEESIIQSELKCLQEIGGQDNVVHAELCLTNSKDCVTFVMPYLPHLRFADYVGEMDADETRLYMKNLFIALKRVHSFNIIHRDVKPDNFLYNRETKQFLLIDFGLAQLVRTTNEISGSSSSLFNKNLICDSSKKRKRNSDCGECDFDNKIETSKRIALRSKDNNKKISFDADAESKRKIFSTQSKASDTFKRQDNKIIDPENAICKSRIFSSSNVTSNKPKKLNDYYSIKSRIRTSSEQAKTELKQNSMKNICLESLDPSKMLNRNLIENTNHITATNKQTSSSLFQLNPKKECSSTSSYFQECLCSGKGAVCSLCSSWERMEAPRGGTSGFRAPEVLFRYLYQTTAVDMWASGVVMLCILSKCYPFFNSSTDLVSLAEIMTIFGTERTIEVASKFGRRILCNENKKGVDLKKLCARLRSRRIGRSESEETYLCEPKCRDCLQIIKDDGCICLSNENLFFLSTPNESDTVHCFPDSAFDLLYRLLDLDPTTRITAEEALQHPFITGF